MVALYWQIIHMPHAFTVHLLLVIALKLRENPWKWSSSLKKHLVPHQLCLLVAIVILCLVSWSTLHILYTCIHVMLLPKKDQTRLSAAFVRCLLKALLLLHRLRLKDVESIQTNLRKRSTVNFAIVHVKPWSNCHKRTPLLVRNFQRLGRRTALFILVTRQFPFDKNGCLHLQDVGQEPHEAQS